MNKKVSCIFTIFGATGDLTHRKLLPALYFLEREQFLGNNFSIVCVARREKTNEQYKEEAKASIKKFSRIKVEDKILNRVLKRIHYYQLEFQQKKRYISLRRYIEKLSKHHTSTCNRTFYLATLPEFFNVIVKNLSQTKLASKSSEGYYSRVVFEKPFGKNLRTAKKLNKELRKVFNENQIYRIDHYLAKELVQNLIVMRFGNSIFEPLWNTKYIDHVQITVAETLGVENRGKFYDRNGSLRDVVQNHILQLLCLTAMEAPNSLDVEDIRDQKVKVLESIAKIKNIRKNSVKGQYTSGILNRKKICSFRQEEGIKPNSTTSSYFAIKFFIDNKTWESVPFYVRTGKRLKERATQIDIVYKKQSDNLFEKDYKLENNILTIRVQPNEGISFKFNSKVPGNKILIDSVEMDFCHECKFGPESAESYEKLLHDVMQGDQTLFTRWDEVENAWKIIDSIRDAWHGVQPVFYKPGSRGPKEADKLLEKDGRKWVILKKPLYAELLLNKK
jgi:glucose-6-phosphate 1-dehydrogenase